MNRSEVVFIATPAIGNLVPIVEFANLLTKHHPQFSATVILITIPQKPLVNTYIQSHASSATNNLRFLHLPTVDPPTPDHYHSSIAFISLHIQNHKNHIKQALLKLMSTESRDHSVQLAALFVDMFSTTIIDVADELSIPCYLFFASPASFLSFTLHLPGTDSIESETEFTVPGFQSFPEGLNDGGKETNKAASLS